MKDVASEREKQWQRWLVNLSDDDLSALARGLSALTNVVKKKSEQSGEQTAVEHPVL